MDFEGFCFVLFFCCLSYQSPRGTLHCPEHPHPPAMAGNSSKPTPRVARCLDLAQSCRQAAGKLHSLQSPPRARQSLCSALPLRCSPCKGRTWIPPPESPWSELGCGFNRQQEQAAAQPGMLLTLFREEPPLSPTTTGRCPDRAFDGQRT